LVLKHAERRKIRTLVPDILAGGGEMGARLRAFDWASTPLGDRSGWPQSLNTTLSIVLNSRQAMFAAWGPELTLIYNDAYARHLGPRHPDAFGRPIREAWAEIWDEISPLVARTLSGEGAWMVDMHLVMTRHGYAEDTWYTFSYSPVRDESGGVGGIFCACNETTAQVLTERRLQFQLRLAERQRTADCAREVVHEAALMLGEQLGLSRAGFAEIDADAGELKVDDDWAAGGAPSYAGSHRLVLLGDQILADLMAGRVIRLDDVERADPVSRNFFAAMDARAALVVPLVRNGRTVAVVYAHAARTRRWTDEDIIILSSALEQTWQVLQTTRAEAALRESEQRLREAQAVGAVGSFDLDMVTNVVHRSPEYLVIQGLPADYPLEGPYNEDWLARVHPDDQVRAAKARERNLAHPGPFEMDFRIVRPDNGEVRWVVTRGLVEADAQGRPVRLLATQSDITARKQEELRRQLLLNELNHRVKNTLATVQSIAAQTLKAAGSVEEAAPVLESRLMALSRAHNVLTRETWEGADLSEIVAGAAGPYCVADRCHTVGPEVRLSPAMALALAMALHELAVNAAKYGALKGETGRVDIRWHVEGAPPHRRLVLRWQEVGGPPVRPPARRGFGTRLLERGLGHELGGAVRIEFLPRGLVCSIEASLDREDDAAEHFVGGLSAQAAFPAGRDHGGPAQAHP
jgi:two-component sensor histidine kinase/PAS domain-containing protein